MQIVNQVFQLIAVSEGNRDHPMNSVGELPEGTADNQAERPGEGG